MHKLLLLRHAKSDWSKSVSDHERPLNKRGKKNAPVMAKRLKERRYRPDKMISSSALRARSTAEVFADVLECDLIIDDALYESDESLILDLIHKIDESIEDLVLVGHNPTLEILAEYLTGESITLPTCAMVHIAFGCDWKDIDGSKGKVIYLDYPKKDK